MSQGPLGEAGPMLVRRLRRGALLSAHLQLADRCNHVCVHCYQVQGQKGELSTADAKRVIDRLSAGGVFLLTVSGGEVTLRHDLFEILAHARSHGMAVTLYTNGFTMTAEMARKIADLAVWQVHISIYGANAKTHDAVTRVGGSFERTLAGVRHLRNAGVHVVLKMPVMQANHDQVDAVRDLAVSLGCSLGINDEIVAREDGDLRAVAFNMAEGEQVCFLRGESRRSEYDRASLERTRRTATCNVGRGAMVIEPNGEARPCTMLAVSLGNAVREDVASLQGGELNTFLRAVDVQTLHGCRDCELIPGCHRCHGNAAAEAGDAFGPYASACNRALANYRASVGCLTVLAPLDGTTRPPGIGPFVIESKGVVRQIPDVHTERDEEIARRYAWVRPRPEWIQRALEAPGGELVQLSSRSICQEQ